MSRADENLPEVVPPEFTQNASPQVLSSYDQAREKLWNGADRDKYPAHYDETPKYPSDTAYTPSTSVDPTSATTQQTGPVAWDSFRAGDPPADGGGNQTAKEERRICGFRKRPFIIIAVVVLVIIAAAVGGGVGATRNRGSPEWVVQPDTTPSSAASAQTTTVTATQTPTSTPSSTSTSTSPTTTPSKFLNNGTAPAGPAFQAFSLPDYLGDATPIIQKEGFHNIGMQAQSYVWLRADTSCCLTFCANETTPTGWWCDTRFRPSFEGSFARIYMWCGGNTNGKKNETCS